MYWIDHHQIFGTDKHMDRDDQFEIHFLITQGTLPWVFYKC